jgi:hypothetical protein
MIKPRPTYEIKNDERYQFNQRPSIWNLMLGIKPLESKEKDKITYEKPKKRH